MRLGLKNLLAAVVLAMASISAFAVPVLWTLTGVAFNDGGTASGSFIFDATTNTYSSVNITTTTGSTRTGAAYSVTNTSISSSTAALYVTSAAANQTGLPALFLPFTSALTNAGGSVNIRLGQSASFDGSESNCGDAACSGPAVPERLMTSGSVTGAVVTASIPTLSEWGMILLSGLLALGTMVVMRRRQI